jgi:alkanesulfonate monooxygenase SsuD/methylene tetrahydromethanopterin reductase-like flavin-dependent oxidoreductase (luciferase family)
VQVGIGFDFRNPAQWWRPWKEYYAANLELIQEAERLGLDAAKSCEHHLFEDGYMPQPLTFLAAVAARTSTIRLSTGVLLAPLHHPAEIAEQAALVDCLSGGRLELPLGTGYRVPEYELFGANINRRFKLLEERVHELRRLWSEGGVTPAPPRGDIPISLGVFGPRGTRLAGRLGAGLFRLTRDHWDDYLEGLEEGGHPRSTARVSGSIQAVLSEDPERDFAHLAPLLEHNSNTYLSSGVEGTDQPVPPLVSAEEMVKTDWERFPYGFGILTPEAAAAQIRELTAGRPIDVVYVNATVSGVIDDFAWRNLELIATKLKPLLADPAAAQGDSSEPVVTAA